MWNRWLAFIGKLSGPDKYLLLGLLAAPLFVFGGEAVGAAAMIVSITLVVISSRLAHRRGLDVCDVQSGTEVCFACRGTFSLTELRKLARYVVLLGPATWVARQNLFCRRCARRQEIMVVALILLLVGAGSTMLVETLGAKGR